jgi:hypothetical protein
MAQMGEKEELTVTLFFEKNIPRVCTGVTRFAPIFVKYVFLTNTKIKTEIWKAEIRPFLPSREGETQSNPNPIYALRVTPPSLGK